MARSENNLETAITAYCSQTGIEPDKIPHIPEDVIANILKRLPAEFLHLVARCVCKTWARILRLPGFIESQMPYSTSCLLVDKITKDGDQAQFIEIRGNETVVADLNFPIDGRVVCSSEGIILIKERGGNRLFVSNPATMQFMELPSLPSPWGLFGGIFSILRIPHSGEIKVLTLHVQLQPDYSPIWNTITLGENMSWKVLNINDQGIGVSVGGVHYVGCDCSTSNAPWPSILAIDLRYETVGLFKVKGPLESYDRSYHLVLLGNCLCCVTYKSHVEFSIRLYDDDDEEIVIEEIYTWKLKNFDQNEWFIIKRIHLTEDVQRNCFYHPKAWLHHHHILVFEVDHNQLVAYYEQTGRWSSIGKMGERFFSTGSILHTSSLISLSS